MSSDNQFKCDSGFGIEAIGKDGGVHGTGFSAGSHGGFRGRGATPATSSVGVLGESGADNGVRGVSVSGAGVLGTSKAGTGVVGISEVSEDRKFTTDGVFGGNNNGSGVHGESKIGTGVFGHSEQGWGVHGSSDRAYGGNFTSKFAQIRLEPASTVGAPASGNHSRGELFVDANGSLFYCKADGTPGTWVQLA